MFEAGNFIPESLDNVNLDYQVIDCIEDGADRGAAGRGEEGHRQQLHRTRCDAGLEPAVVDVDYFALENMYELNYAAERESGRSRWSTSARATLDQHPAGGRSTFTGDVPVGGAEFTDALMRNLGVLARGGRTAEGGRPVRAIDARAGRAGAAARSRSSWSRRSTARSASSGRPRPTSKSASILLTGGTSRVPGLVSLLAERLEVPVHIANPFANVRLAHGVDRAALERDAASFAIAVGLGVRRPGDK